MHGGRWFFRFERSSGDNRADEQVGGGAAGDDAESKGKEVNFHKLIWEEYFPLAFSIGISLEEFKKLTPKTLGYCLEGEKLRRKERDREVWLWTRQYGLPAIIIGTRGGAWGKDKVEYPEQAIYVAQDPVEQERLAERKRQELLAQLMGMQESFERNKKEGGGTE